MKKFTTYLFCFFSILLHAQDLDRIAVLEDALEEVALSVPKLKTPLKVNLELEQISIADFLVSISKIHQINLTIDPSLKNKFIVSQFSNITVLEVLVYLCKNQNLTLDITGSILYIKPYEAPAPIPDPIKISYEVDTRLISLDLKNHELGEVFKTLTQQTDYNVLYDPSLEHYRLNFYMKRVPIEDALNQLANTQKLSMERTKEGFFLFNTLENGKSNKPTFDLWENSVDSPFVIIDLIGQRLRLNAKEVPIKDLIINLAHALKINWYVTQPLEEMGVISLKIKEITFDALLELLFEAQFKNAPSNPQAQNQQQNNMGYKKSNNRYYFGPEDSLNARSAIKITLQHRSIEMLGDPTRVRQNDFQPTPNFQNQSFGQNRNFGGNQFSNGLQNGMNQQNFSMPTQNFPQTNQPTEKPNETVLSTLIPQAISAGLQINVDKELNAFVVVGSHLKVERFKQFIEKIDQPVPVILIEVMLIEVNKTKAIETGVSWGLGEEPTETTGNLFPATDAKLGATTVNRIIGGFSQLRSLNLGSLHPNFFMQLKALEDNGTVKILSSPKMATLNGHRAVFSNSEISYYAYTAQNFYGIQNPQTSEIKNYIPISAGLTLSVKPFVTSDGSVTLDIFVKQSTFNNTRIAEDAPPGIESREFSSIVRMRNKDIAILGGLEQNVRNNSGNGVPFLSRIPILKWLFSNRSLNSSKKKLTVLIQPTLIN